MATHKKRLDRLNKLDDPMHRILFDKELYTMLAAEGIISAETLETIKTRWGSFKHDPLECFTDDELRRTAALCEDN